MVDLIFKGGAKIIPVETKTCFGLFATNKQIGKAFWDIELRIGFFW